MRWKKWAHALIAIVVGTSTVRAEEIQRAVAGFDPKSALAAVYGGNTWKDPKLAKYFPPVSDGSASDVAYLSLGFDASYVEGGQQKHVIVSLLTPAPAETYNCHACSPLIGAAVLRLVGGRWEIESASKIIKFVTVGYEFSLVNVGPDRYGVLLHQRDSHQGYEMNRFDLLLPDHGNIRQSLSIGFDENPSPGACEDASGQSGDLTFDTVDHKELYDVLTVVKKNEGECGHLKATVQQGRYEYAEDAYRLVKQ
jgi:hypothetical protein